MKILQVTTQKPYSTGSGVYLSGILNELAKEHEQHLICGLNAGEDAAFLGRQHSFTLDPVIFQTEELPFSVPGMSDVMPYSSRRYDSLTSNESGALMKAFEHRLQKVLDEFHPDVLICHHLYLITALTSCKVKEAWDLPVVGICHGSDLRQFQHTDRWRKMIRSGIQALDGIISTHEEQARVIAELFQVPAGRIWILGSGYDDSIFKPDPRVQKKDRPLRIVYTGKLAAAKGVPELLKATDLVVREEEIHLTLIGGGGDPSETELIQEMAEGKPYPVVLTGQISQEEAADIYHRSHIFVLPSYFEGMPLVVPEALASGLKVAVTDLPGFREWLRPYAGRVRLIPLPAMESLDRPTEDGRRCFIEDIAKAIVSLSPMQSCEAIDLSNLSWQGLAERISGMLKEVSREK